jgi:hypothetical protein
MLKARPWRPTITKPRLRNTSPLAAAKATPAPQTITDYVPSRQGFLAWQVAELANRQPRPAELKLSPYVTAGAQYYKAMQADFNLITQI